jgi:hypothetical protein
MTKHDTEMVDTRCDDFAYDLNVEDRYGKASHDRMAELLNLLLKAKAQSSLDATKFQPS